MKIAIGVPLPSHVPPDFIRNLIGIITYTMKNFKGLESLGYFDKEGVRTDRNRNIILQKVIEEGYDYILWLDADMLYPHDIICKYLEKDFDIMGCLYFKRSAPYDPIAYIEGDNIERPYKALDPLKLPKDSVIEVDGLGYGGMMVNLKLYEKMGDDKWTKYGPNFHLPYFTEGQLTHDLQFCKTAQRYGAEIMLHTGVKPGHIGNQVYTQSDWEKARIVKNDSVVAIIPAKPSDYKKALVTAKLLEKRAGHPIKIVVEKDTHKAGWVSMINKVVKENPADYYVYLAADVFPGRNWLKIGLESMKKVNKKLLAMNDGKWNGRMASFGIVDSSLLPLLPYSGNLFNPSYKSHYADPELSVLAMSLKEYAYSPDCVMIEADPFKDGKKNDVNDRNCFHQRKLNKFDGFVQDESLINLFG